FRHRWTVMSFARLVSATSRIRARRGTRRSAVGGHGLALQDESRKQIVVSWLMLESGAAGPLQTELASSPAVLPSAHGLLTGSPQPLVLTSSIAPSIARRNGLYGRAWGALLSAVLISVVAAAGGAAHHAPW